MYFDEIAKFHNILIIHLIFCFLQFPLVSSISCLLSGQLPAQDTQTKAYKCKLNSYHTRLTSFEISSSIISMMSCFINHTFNAFCNYLCFINDVFHKRLFDVIIYISQDLIVHCDNSTLTYMDTGNQCRKRKLQISWKFYAISAHDFLQFMLQNLFFCFLKNAFQLVSFGLALTLNNVNSDSILH